jgi:hypothetical protein
MSNKTYTVAGVSTQNGVTKPRFASDMDSRVFMLNYTGHKDIKLVNLPTEMTKMQAVQFLQTNEHFQDDAAQGALLAYIEKNTPKAAGKRGRPLKLPTLADVPVRGENGAFLKREVREQMLADMIAEKISQHEAKKAKAAAKAAAAAAAPDTAQGAADPADAAEDAVAQAAAAAEAEDDADDEQDDPVAEDAADETVGA